MIKPCPFCGYDPEIGPKDPKIAFVRCFNEKCPTFHRSEDHGVQVTYYGNGPPHRMRIVAVRMWNRRAS